MEYKRDSSLKLDQTMVFNQKTRILREILSKFWNHWLLMIYERCF